MSAPRFLSRARLRRAGLPGADAYDWAARAALALFAVAGAVALWALVRPLPHPRASETLAPSADAPAIAVHAESVEERRARINDLARLNRFAAGGLPWKPKVEPLPEATGATSPDGTPVQQPAVSETQKVDPALTPLDRVPDDVKKALAALELRGLRSDDAGVSLAMISRVHNQNRSASTPYRVGDEFEEESNAQAKWRVVAIDWLQRRVLLLRSGVTVALPLYKGEASLAAAQSRVKADAEAADPAAPAARQKPDPERVGLPGAPAVAITERAEAIAQLKAAGVSDADIAEIIALLDEPVAKPVRTADAEAKGEKPAERAAPPPGMEAIIKLMQEQGKQAAPAEGEQPRPKRRRRNPQ